MTKTNKSYTKRIRTTRSGKLVARVPGQNHFNAKEPGEKRLRRSRTQLIVMNSKEEGRFLGKKRN
jgi:ribosomal protein L35